LLKNDGQLAAKLQQELGEGKGTEMVDQMAKDKAIFMRKHVIKSTTDFSKAETNLDILKSGAVVSIPRKRQASGDADDLMEHVDKKDHKKKRAKH